MKVRTVRLIHGPPAPLAVPDAPLFRELPRIRERRGEIIVAADTASGTTLGAIGIFPDKDEGGALFRLAGMEIFSGAGETAVDELLLEQAGAYMAEHRVRRLAFGTSPLITASALLYVTRFGARYVWREGARTPEGQPWPHVSCECDFDDPLAKPLDLRDDEIPSRSVLLWRDGVPVTRKDIKFVGPLSLLLPELDAERIAAEGRRVPDFLETIYGAFHALHLHGYGFAWFDRLSEAARSSETPPFYYLMRRTMTL